MEVAAKLVLARVSPLKARLVANLVRGLPVGKALDTLKYTSKKSAKLIYKVLMSAIANAEHNRGADVDELKVQRIFVDQGPVLKRMRPRAKGRGNRIAKPTCHITVVVGYAENEGAA